MPGIEIEPLEDEHLAAAAGLLAVRHARHRETEALLPAISDFRAQLERDLAHETAGGVVALSGDDLVAYVIGRVEEDPLLGDQRAVVDFAGCAAAGGQGDAIRDLYAALAARWVAAGATRHVAFVPASDEALTDPWLRLAFGVQAVLAVRETAAMKPVGADVRIRPGMPDDLELVMRLDRTLIEHHAAPPSFSGLPIPSDEELRAEWSDLWDDPELYTHFVAERAGQPLGHAVLYRRPTGDLRVPEDNIDLSHAATLPTARRSGVSLALMGHALTWAHEHGFRSMTTDWRSVNLLASRHWPRLGFRPTHYRLYRALP
ncbi:MAG: GNAT family N-acetyltransferase [Actinobacteria bacterium]|nr:MAG: GNAT family N-acetyltransferase [Actinomycetota bacterium]